MNPRNKQTIMITGASSGIGLGLAKRYALEGHIVIVCARRIETLKTELAPLMEAFATIDISQCDVSIPSELKNWVQSSLQKWQSIDVFIANAGISKPSVATTPDFETIQETMQLNFLGAVHGIMEILPHFLERNAGHIVAISSIAGYRGLPGASAYCASKAALSSFTESIRVDLHRLPIHVTLICPGFIKTAITDKNKFHMPFLMPLEKGVQSIYKAIQSKRRIYTFPWPMAFLSKIITLLPAWLFDRILSALTPKSV